MIDIKTVYKNSLFNGIVISGIIVFWWIMALFLVGMCFMAAIRKLLGISDKKEIKKNEQRNDI